MAEVQGEEAPLCHVSEEEKIEAEEAPLCHQSEEEKVLSEEETGTLSSLERYLVSARG
jgi:hypothetical protein